MEMKKFVLLALVMLAPFLSFSAGVERLQFRLGERAFGLYVKDKGGADVLSEPNEGGRKVAGLLYGDYVVPVEVGGRSVVGGIEDSWVKVLLYPEDCREKGVREFGWVFGGCLTDGIYAYREDELRRLLQKRGYHHAPNFQDDFDTNYMVYDGHDDFAVRKDKFANYEVGEWRNGNSRYDRALPVYFSVRRSSNIYAVTVREAFFIDDDDYFDTKAYATMRLLKPFTRVWLRSVCGWGIERRTGTLYPVYIAVVDGRTGRIRGIDIADELDVSTALYRKNRRFSLVYQTALTGVRSDGEGGTGFRKEEIEGVLNDHDTYDKAFLDGSTEITAVCFMDGKGRSFRVPPSDFVSRKGSLRILYPLNDLLPSKIVEQTSVGLSEDGSATFSRSLYTLDDGGPKYYGADAKATHVCTYSATTSRASERAPKGIANHFFDGPLLFVYEFQTDGSGRVVRNETRMYEQNRTIDPYRFVGKHGGEPRPFERIERREHKAGDYANPVCRLKMRSRPSMDGDSVVFGRLEAGTLLRVVEVGAADEIDGIRANWLKAEAVNPEVFVEGTPVKGGWVFGGYLD